MRNRVTMDTFSSRVSMKRNRFKPSELSDRIMGLNRMEQKNLENKIRAIEKETRVKMGFINRDIKQLEYEAGVQRSLVDGFNQNAKIKFLNAHLHMVLLNERKLEFEMNKFKMTQDLLHGKYGIRLKSSEMFQDLLECLKIFCVV